MSGAGDNPKVKANEYAINVLNQLLTLSSAILALTITFIKDALGDARNTASGKFLIPIAWGLLGIVIWTAWVATADACKQIGNATTTEYVFGSGITMHLAKIAQYAFQMAITLLILFVVINYRLFFAVQEVAKAACK